MALTPFLQQRWQELYTTTLINPFLFSLLLFSLLFILKFIKGGTKLNLPPSPSSLPIIGHLHLLGSLPHRSLRALSEKYGPIILLHLGRAPTLVVTSAEIAKEIMRTQDVGFANRVQTRSADVILYRCGDLGFAPYGEYWRQMRRICVLQLLSLKRVQSYGFIREEEVAELIQNLRDASLDGASVDIGQMMVYTSTNIVSRCVLGRMYEGDENKKRFGELARTAMLLMGEFCFQDLFPSLGWMDVLTGLVKRLRDTAEGLDAFLDEVIEDYRSSRGSDKKHESECFLEILLQEKESMPEFEITQDNIKAVLLDMFIGGTDTTATSMEWAMTQLMKNPTKMKKAQEEVRRVVGKKSKIEQEDIDRMDYLKCVIKETLRLHPPGPFLVPRESIESAKLEGYDIPPKTRVFINAWAIHRDPKLWERPEEFLPERFANNPIDFKGQDFQYIPFGAGRRGCPGISFAVMGTEYVLANLLYWFDWRFPGGAGVEDLDMSEAYGIVVSKKIPLHVVPVSYSL